MKTLGLRCKTLTPTPEPAGYCAGDVAGERGASAASATTRSYDGVRSLAWSLGSPTSSSTALASSAAAIGGLGRCSRAGQRFSRLPRDLAHRGRRSMTIGDRSRGGRRRSIAVAGRGSAWQSSSDSWPVARHVEEGKCRAGSLSEPQRSPRSRGPLGVGDVAGERGAGSPRSSKRGDVLDAARRVRRLGPPRPSAARP